jgi:hypothetical protein
MYKQKMKEASVLCSYEFFGQPMNEEVVGVFTSQNGLKRYLSELKKAGKLEKEDIKKLLTENEAIKFDLSYKIKKYPLNPDCKKVN